MEIALDAAMPTYSGGLGVLAGDFLRSAADLGFPMVGVTLAYRDGYFRQHLAADGTQSEALDPWDPSSRTLRIDVEVAVEIEGHPVRLCVWCHTVAGRGGSVPVLLLDADVADNRDDDRLLTSALYSGDARHRLAQEVILGLGGAAALHALGLGEIEYVHMNEGHSALVVSALLEQSA